ncbi:hypothetical protein AB0J83_13340 [Actinoplanes sp. NPDC049596]|uniref:hypothetical protein n=1 Tax=unclassified Actinoplanes TaxID=2626549 RepID=UPI003448CC84
MEAQTTETTPQVSPGQRYAAAWAEINARLTSRQTVCLSFATISITLASLIVGGVLGPQAAGFVRDGWLTGICCGLVALAWTFVLWIRHNDATIGLLSAFCKALEKIDDPASARKLPAWHNEFQGWMTLARDLRRLSDRAVAIIAGIATLPSVAAVIGQVRDPEWVSLAALVVATLVGSASVRFALENAKRREEIADHSFRADGEGRYRFQGPPPPRPRFDSD